MKLHPYHQDVPYMQAYDPILLDSDRYSDLLLRRLNHGYPSFHHYGKNPPATVLDLGCGPGHWVLHAATVWKTSQVTGLDLVDLALPGFETTENANFVLGNFLAFDLPFPDNSFDYVRMANLVLCIPYEQWDYVLRQVHRVLTVNGRMELIDDQIFFPYSMAPKQPSFSSPGDMSDVFDDAYFDDKETLQGSASDVGSTLNDNSESSNSSCEDQIFDSPTLRRFASYQSSMPTGSSSPGAALHTESRCLSWRAQATASRELESIFEIMLKQRYKIFPRPSDFILSRMQGIFGRDAAGKTRSYHIKLAPIYSAVAQGKADGESIGGTMKRMAWMGMDREKFLKKKEKKLEKVSKDDTITGGGSDSSSERSSLENASTPSSLSASMNGILGMAFGPPDRVPLLSAKAAGRLGISYSDLAAAATTVASTPQQPHASPSSPMQSPGLFVWPSTFIPLPPAELEMHANKYVHTLLGCKPALADFIAQFTDEDDTRFVEEDEFHDIVWQYECFRRSRFNWPSEIPDPYDDDESVTPTPIFFPPPQKSKSNKTSLDLYSGEELTHIRTIRVFEATKSDWSFSSLFHQKIPGTS
jgi:SAM-dependent methyltransferase